MTLVECLKSGKPFTKKTWPNGEFIQYDKSHRFTTEEVMSDDWEIKQGPRECWIHPNAIDTLKEEGTYTASISKYQDCRSGWILVREVTE